MTELFLDLLNLSMSAKNPAGYLRRDFCAYQAFSFMISSAAAVNMSRAEAPP